MLINAISSLFSASSSKMTSSVSGGKGSFGSQSANQITLLSASVGALATAFSTIQLMSPPIHLFKNLRVFLFGSQ
ncbi:hypothetical protein PPL_10979 [Heterostelium album PN500]|uniref:Uncharacterized protein n=1 Tax=Heterostelium pallidum (strain ATCC 26659 / Pp 5 / PN500) TaxID=670386 RepID=D3BSL0_HETP5|nr:hypothetical protein PPL_10979 [Heterostelium album PN500]EFA75475.1 hypothetical protein PPL_10979 [Heterostelium album PN500]|eukprot:XP_020427609.1 hypothetical protein PPL_10979 [Heterostelium album PN500]